MVFRLSFFLKKKPRTLSNRRKRLSNPHLPRERVGHSAKRNKDWSSQIEIRGGGGRSRSGQDNVVAGLHPPAPLRRRGILRPSPRLPPAFLRHWVEGRKPPPGGGARGHGGGGGARLHLRFPHPLLQGGGNPGREGHSQDHRNTRGFNFL